MRLNKPARTQRGAASGFMTPASCRAQAAALRTGARGASAAASHQALLVAADEYEKLAREIEHAREIEKAAPGPD